MTVPRLKTIELLILVSAAAITLTVSNTADGQPAPGACGYYRNSYGNEVPRPCGNWHVPSTTPPTGATALCGDGTYSYSQHPYSGGTCSHHGGVVQRLE